MTPEQAAETIEAMKAEARKMGPASVAWRECGEMLINCRARGNRLEWRVLRDVKGGNVIKEQAAERYLIQNSGWIGGGN